MSIMKKCTMQTILVERYSMCIDSIVFITQ